jgi:hypothetical protein
MNKLIDILRKRWGVTSAFQVVIILIVFAVTGFSTLYVHRFIDHLLGIGKEDPFWLKALVFIVIILPLYTVLLYIWGFLVGQRKFFTTFIKLKIRLISGNRLYKDND